MEAAEITEFSKQMQEAGEASMTRVSLVISVLAVLVALVTVFSHREHTEAVLSQAKASDRWAEYQGRRTRQSQYLLAAELLQLQRPSSPATDHTAQSYQARQQKLQEQLDEDAREAHLLEAEVSVAERRAARFDLGEALLQIAVVLASITLLTRRWWYVLAAIGLGILGLGASAAALLIH